MNQGTITALSSDINTKDTMSILPLSDLHIGDAHCNEKLVQGLVNKIKYNDNMYTLLVGDLMNSAITNSKSDSYNECLTPSQQIDKCYDLLNPIRSKILAIVPGNHEERVSRSVGIDTTKILSDRLGLSDRYRSTSALLILRIGNDLQLNKSSNYRPQFYSIYMNHGHGGGRKIGGKMNGLQDFSSIVDADIIISGHTHTPAVFRQSHFRISMPNYVARQHEMVFVNCPSALSYGGYGDRNGYQPPSNKYPEIILSSSEHKIDVIL